MLRGHSPTAILDNQLDLFLHELPSVRNGTTEAIHQARVTVRRIRETAALACRNFDEPEFKDVVSVLRRASRSLGRARDADVATDLLHELELRASFALSPLAHLRRLIADEQQSARRRAIKTLESLDLHALPRRLSRARRHARFLFHGAGSGWRRVQRAQIGARATAVREAMQHASGVYFPNRAHTLRVAIKKLRYTLELAAHTRTWQAPRALKKLKKAQDVLGSAHDREVLIDRLQAANGTEQGAGNGSEGEALASFLRSECLALHATYLALRPRLEEICDECERFARPRRATTGALIAASVTVPSLLLLARDQRTLPVAERRILIKTSVFS